METHHHQPSSSAVIRHHEHMFEKPLTPSDVGKPSRLVIPKQHAEKYFPMADQQKGLVLSFEDESGRLWRFRYSYWNSSQSYVLTNGWSRYVKEKGLDAGDVVLFQRHVLDCDRMFIRWRCRSGVTLGGDQMAAVAVAYAGGGGGDGAQENYPDHQLSQPLPLPYKYEEIYENVDTYQRGEVATRQLRLFGVNLECQDNPEQSDPYGSTHGGQSDYRYNFTSNNLHHKDEKFGALRAVEGMGEEKD